MPGLATNHGMILSRDFAAVVDPVTLAIGHAGVFLDDPPLHLRDEGGPQFLLRCHRGFEVGILRLEVGFHRRILAIPQPEIVVLPDEVVNLEGVRTFFGERRFGGGHGGKEKERTSDQAGKNDGPKQRFETQELHRGQTIARSGKTSARDGTRWDRCLYPPNPPHSSPVWCSHSGWATMTLRMSRVTFTGAWAALMAARRSA